MTEESPVHPKLPIRHNVPPTIRATFSDFSQTQQSPPPTSPPSHETFPSLTQEDQERKYDSPEKPKINYAAKLQQAKKNWHKNYCNDYKSGYNSGTPLPPRPNPPEVMKTEIHLNKIKVEPELLKNEVKHSLESDTKVAATVVETGIVPKDLTPVSPVSVLPVVEEKERKLKPLVSKTDDLSAVRVYGNENQNLKVACKTYRVPRTIALAFSNEELYDTIPKLTYSDYIARDFMLVELPATVVDEHVPHWLSDGNLADPKKETWLLYRKMAMAWCKTVQCSAEMCVDIATWVPYLSWVEARKRESLIEPFTSRKIINFSVVLRPIIFFILICFLCFILFDFGYVKPVNLLKISKYDTKYIGVYNFDVKFPCDSHIYQSKPVYGIFASWHKSLADKICKDVSQKSRLSGSQGSLWLLHQIADYNGIPKLPSTYVCEDFLYPYFILGDRECEPTPTQLSHRLRMAWMGRLNWIYFNVYEYNMDTAVTHLDNLLSSYQSVSAWWKIFIDDLPFAQRCFFQVVVSQITYLVLIFSTIMYQIFVYSCAVHVFFEEFFFLVLSILSPVICFVFRLFVGAYESRKKQTWFNLLGHLVLGIFTFGPVWLFCVQLAFHLLINEHTRHKLDFLALYKSRNSYLPRPKKIKKHSAIADSDYMGRYLKCEINRYKTNYSQILYGLDSGPYRPTYFSPNKQNEEQALFARVVKDTPTVDVELITECINWAKTHKKQLFGKKTIKSHSIDVYLKNSNASPQVKIRILEAYLSLKDQGIDEHTKLTKQQLRDFTKRKSFVKVENMNYKTPLGVKQKAPRLIQGAEPEFIALVGPWIQSLQGYFKKKWGKKTFYSFHQRLE